MSDLTPKDPRSLDRYAPFVIGGSVPRYLKNYGAPKK
jgi:hypothetical protein